MVPVVENLGDSRVIIAADVFQQQISFGNELHIGVFDAVVDHLDVVAGTVGTDIGAARLTVRGFGGNGFINGLDFGVRFLIAAGHDGRAAASSRFPAGNAHAVEVDARFLAAFATALSIPEVGVAAVDDDISLIEAREELVDHAVDRRSGHDHEHDFARPFEGGQEFIEF